MCDIVSREEAVEACLRFYFDGEECSNGHLADKFTSNGKCKECVSHQNQENLFNLNIERIEKNIARAVKRKARGEKVVKLSEDEEEHLKYLRQREAVHKARKWMEGTENTLSAEELLDLFYEQGEECKVCFTKFKDVGYVIEHIVPIQAYGSNRKDNIQLLCASCNNSKNNKHYPTWVSKVRYLQVTEYLEYLAGEGY